MENARVIDTLNKAIALEHAATVQYKQHALLVRGLWRKVFADYFFAASRSAQEHAYRFGQKVVALGGVAASSFYLHYLDITQTLQHLLQFLMQLV